MVQRLVCLSLSQRGGERSRWTTGGLEPRAPWWQLGRRSPELLVFVPERVVVPPPRKRLPRCPEFFHYAVRWRRTELLNESQSELQPCDPVNRNRDPVNRAAKKLQFGRDGWCFESPQTMKSARVVFRVARGTAAPPLEDVLLQCATVSVWAPCCFQE